VAEGLSKVFGDFVRGGFAGDLAEIAKGSVPFWRTFLERFVVPNASAAAWLIALGELAVGIGLVLGLWTRSRAPAARRSCSRSRWAASARTTRRPGGRTGSRRP
jgi:uncharacterized membrane protein YphA (DoxX/SURF4 family)